MFRRLMASGGALAAGAALLLSGSGNAGAAVPEVAVAHSGSSISTAGQYCAAWAPTGAIACVAQEKDFAAAKAAVVPQTSRLGARAASSASPQLSYLLGRFFDDAGYSTASGYIDWFGSAGCTSTLGDTNSSWSDTTTWRGRISSFTGGSGCRIKGYEVNNFGGAVTNQGNYISQLSNLGQLNDHIWSARFS